MSSPLQPQFARDYVFSAQIASLGYAAAGGSLPLNATGATLADAITRSGHNGAFTPAELQNFSDNYRFVGSTSPGPGRVGGDAVAFQNLATGSIIVGVAGVNDHEAIPYQELAQTDISTYFTGANGRMYADIQSFVFGLMEDFPSAQFDLNGHSAGGAMVQLVAADASLRGLSSKILSINTFGSYGIKFGAQDNINFLNVGIPNLANIIKRLDEIEETAGFVHFRNNSDAIPKYSDWSRYRLAGPTAVDLIDLLGPLDGIAAHNVLAYVRSLRENINNQSAVVLDSTERTDAISVVASLLGISGNQAEEIVVSARSGPGNSNLSVMIAHPEAAGLPQIDAVTGAPLPERLRRVTSIFGANSLTSPDGTLVIDQRSRVVELDVATVNGVTAVARSRASDGFVNSADGSVRAGVTVETTYSGGRAIDTKIRLNDNPFYLEFSDVGAALGQQLGYRLAGGNQLVGVVSSATLKTIGDNLGDALDGLVGNQSANNATEDAFSAFGPEFLTNLKAAGIGAVSSFLTAELINTIGLNGFAGQVANTAAGAAIGQIATNAFNLATLTNPVASDGSPLKLFSDVNPTMILTAAGSFLGTRLAQEVISFDTIGGQIGSAVGASLGVVVALEALKIGALIGGPLGAAVGAAIGAFVGFIAGGLIGSIFGGTPRSGADAAWDAAEQKFAVDNVWSRKGGSKDTAKSLASAVSETLNSVLGATGGELMDPAAVQTGSYGMVKKEFVYRPVGGGSESGPITKRFKGKDAAGNLVGYGLYQALNDPDFKIAGGDVYVKRALYNSFSIGGLNPEKFDANVILGNIASAQAYERYLANSTTINAIVAAEPDSIFTAETALTLARAVELGLTKRHASDWFGGITFLLKEADTSAGNVEFGFDYDPFSDRVSRLTGVGGYVLGDAIDIAGQTAIEGTIAADIIDLRSAMLADQSGYTVNGQLNNNIALTGADFTGVTTAVINFAATDLRKQLVVSLATDGLLESTETFLGTLTNAPGMAIVDGEAIAMVIDDAGSLATLMVGNSYAHEADGHAIFRLRLSKAATEAVTVALTLADGRATGASLDYGAAGLSNLQVSSDGIAWTDATSATFAVGVTELFVRTAVIADNVVNPAYVEGNGEPQYLNVEGNERFTLNATVSAGASVLANGADTVSGTGTIVDGAGTEPLVWIDNVVVHEATGQAVFTVSRSRTAATATTVDFSTADRRVLKIEVAATVDGGDGNDTIYASNLGDNIFGGAGNDSLYGGRLDDWLLGGDGNDTLDAGTADQTALGGDGNYLNGGAGNDILKGREGSDWLEGGDGVDTLTGGAADDILTGGGGDGDQLLGGSGDDQYLVRLGDGADFGEDQTDGTPPVDPALAGDFISRRFAGLTAGTIAADWAGRVTPGITAGKLSGGEDAITFGQGVGIGDVVLKRDPLDRDNLLILVMQTDAETGVTAYSGTQLIIKDWFSDPFKRVEWLRFADGNAVRLGDVTSFVIGGSGNDVLIGTLGNDFIYGGDGSDRLFLLAGDDIGSGGTGNDFLAGDSGNDLMLGGTGNDNLIGGKGKDAITGDAGSDYIYGGDDDDILSGGAGDDQIVAGGGDDTIKFSRGDGKDVIVDDLSDNWTVIWRANGTAVGSWQNGYTYDQTTGIVRDAQGNIIRRNLGSADQPDFQWVGELDYDSLSQTLKRWVPPAAGVLASRNNSGALGDTIEFTPGIRIDDVIIQRIGDDLILFVGNADTDAGSSAGIADTLTLKDWYLVPGSIERLAFFGTGILSLTDTALVGGTDSDDTLSGTDATYVWGSWVGGADWLTSGTGDDNISAGSGDDILSGGSGADTLFGGAGLDVLYGGSGEDNIVGGAGADVLIGGAGLDTASYEGSTGVRVNLTHGYFNTGDASGDTFDGIENLTGSAAADLLDADSGENVLDGGKGNDTLRADAGDDTYVWNALSVSDNSGADLIVEGVSAPDVALDEAGGLGAGYIATARRNGSHGLFKRRYDHLLTVTYNGVTIYSKQIDRVRQKNYPTNVVDWPQDGWLAGYERTGIGEQVAKANVDTITDGGDDKLELGEGIQLADLTFAYEGNDLVVTYRGSAAASMRLRNQKTLGGRVETLQLHDGLAASLTNLALGVDGGAEEDFVVGTLGADTLRGAAGDDVVFGNAGNDLLYGDAGDDVIEGGAGADTIDGGAHSEATVPTWGDTARYASSSQAVQVDLAVTSAQAGGDAAGDILAGVENLVGSEAGADILAGDEGANRLLGLGGNDTLLGRGGDDVLVGDEGNDSLDGGDGDDALHGGAGIDYLVAGAGKDQLFGSEGSDVLDGGDGNDALGGGAGNDQLLGGAGDDQLFGEDGNDVLVAGDGDDTLGGEAGDDMLQGGAGADLYVFGQSTGNDTITDAAGANTIGFDQSVDYKDLWLTRAGDDLRIGVIGGDSIVHVTGYFTGVSAISTIVAGNRSLFVDHSDVRALIAEMTASSATTPAEMPGNIAIQLDRKWDVGESAAPLAPAVAPAIGVAGNVPLNSGANLVALGGWPDPAALPSGAALVSGWENASALADETRWVAATGPGGSQVAVIEAGQSDSDVQGGGNATNAITLDGSKSYEFDYYFQVTDPGKHDIVFGLGGASGAYVLDVATGNADSDAIFYTATAATQTTTFQAGRWYKLVAPVLAEGASVADASTIGGIYDVTTGERVAGLDRLYRWNPARPDNAVSARFFDTGGEAKQLYSTRFYQPEIHQLAGLQGTLIEAGVGVIDHDSAILNYSINPNGVPAKGTLELVDGATGQVRYTPYWGARGDDAFSIIASDVDGNQTAIPIRVSVSPSGINRAPSAPELGFTLAHSENSIASALIGTVAATDSDGPTSALDYRFTGSVISEAGGQFLSVSSDGRYVLNRDTGEVRTATADQDYETNTEGFSYGVTVTDRNSGALAASIATTLTITLGNIDEAHTLTNATVELNELGVALGPYIPAPDVNGYAINLAALMLEDPEGSNLRWRLATGQAPGPWSIDTDGTLYMLGATDYETIPTYNLAVEAIDDATGLTRSATLTIQLRDSVDERVNGGAPVQFGAGGQRGGYYATGLESIRLSDGSTRTAEQIAALFVAGQQSLGNDNIFGTTFADSIDAKSGDDVIYAGIGNDTLLGGSGNDVYRFELGDGQDVVDDVSLGGASGGTDTIRFGANILPEDVRISQSPDGLHFFVAYGAGNDTVRLTNALGDDAQVIEAITFQNGVSWTFSDIFARSLSNNAGNDIFYGTAGSESMTGGAGDDVVTARGGDDTLLESDGDDNYVWNLGDGNDVLSGGGASDGFNTLQFGAGIAAADLRYAYTDMNATGLTVTVAGQGGSITLGQQLSGGGNERIDRIRFFDGSILTRAQFQSAAFAQIATVGPDTLRGSNASGDVLAGGLGNDILIGRDGDDTYGFAVGDGQDIVRDHEDAATLGAPGNDSLAFAVGILPGDIDIVQANEGADLIVTRRGTSERILLENTIDSSLGRIETIRFADGTAWDFAEQLRRSMLDNAGDNIFYGGFDDNLLFGGTGNDTLYGRGGGDRLRGWEGNDLLIGGIGNDILSGDNGDDTYRFSRGDGQDQVHENGQQGSSGGFDTIELSAGIAISDVTIVQSGPDNLVVKINGTGDEVTIAYTLRNADYRVEALRFADNTVWNASEIFQRSIAANVGNNSFYGSYDSETIDGGTGDDWLRGWEGKDVLIGGTGSDILSGDGGNDVYRFARGDGQDVVIENSGLGSSGGFDVIEFATGIVPSEITVEQANTTDVVLRIAATGETVTLRNQLTDPANLIEAVHFADGTVWGVAELFRRSIATNDGSEIFHGSYDADYIAGGPGDDVLVARARGDVLVGGAGNDTLRGEGGSDFYRFAATDGHDIVNDAGTSTDVDTIELASGIAVSDVTIARTATDLIIGIAGISNTITLQNTLLNGASRIEWLRFADGTMWGATDMFVRAGGVVVAGGGATTVTVSGTAGADTLSGSNANDRILGGASNDILNESSGDDVYVWNIGDGDDIIRGGGSWDGTNTVEFGAGIGVGDLRYSAVGTGSSLKVTFVGQAGSIILENQLSGDNAERVDQFRFADGTVLNREQIMTAALAQFATSGTDIIYGSNSAQAIDAGAGNDTILGGSATDWLLAGVGDDTINARGGDDILIGGLGNDFLAGGGGDDVFRFARGDGQDTIRDYYGDGGFGGIDTVEFAAGIAVADIIVTQGNNGQDLILSIAGTSDSVTLSYSMNNSDHHIEQVRFADGTLWTNADLVQNSIAANAGADNFYGSYEADTLASGSGNDTVVGRGGDDIIIGGAGNDFLAGGSGHDVFRFGRGDGQDTIRDYYSDGGFGGIDTVEFAAGIAVADIIVTQGNNGQDLILSIAGTSDSVTLSYSMNNSDHHIEQVRFADGTLWTNADLVQNSIAANAGADNFYGSYEADTLASGSGNDTVVGRGGDDIIIGGAGNDFLAGGSGHDVFRFGRGDGQDTIRDYYSDGGFGGIDTVEFAAGIAVADIIVTQGNNGQDLILSIAGTSDSVTLSYSMNNSDHHIEQVRFADGTLWTNADLVQNSIAANAGADNFYGSYEADTLASGSGNDTVVGRGGDDIIIGGTGNDFLAGGSGHDVFRFARGDGQDTIRDYYSDGGFGGNDTVEFAAGILPSDVSIWTGNNGRDIVLAINGTTDRVTLFETLYNSDNYIEQVRFSDGTTWNRATIVARAVSWNDAANNLLGTTASETLRGAGGNDHLEGAGGDDELFGDEGNDQIVGDSLSEGAYVTTGSNLVVNGSFEISGTIINSGSWGQSNSNLPGWAKTNSQHFEQLVSGFAGVVATHGGYWLDMGSTPGPGSNMDILQTISGLGAGQVFQLTFDHIDRTGGSSGAMEVRWNGAIVAQVTDGGTVLKSETYLVTAIGGDNVLQFVGLGAEDYDGASLDNVRLLATSPIAPAAGNDTIIGGSGNDLLIGGSGNDRYIFDAGDGQDVIQEASDGGIDRIVFGSGIAPGDIIVAGQGNGDILFQLNGSSDQVLSKGDAGDNTIEEVEFVDGTVWTRAALDAFLPRFTSGPDTITGTAAHDVLSGGGGDDQISGVGGNDSLSGDDGNDQLEGGSGADVLTGGAGLDILLGGDGDDVFHFGVNDDVDVIDGGVGNDRIEATVVNAVIGISSLAGIEVITGNGFAGVTVAGTASADTLDFGSMALIGIASIDAGAGDDSVTGSSGDDTANGGEGSDVLTGALGSDALSGGAGADQLFGDIGSDTLSGDGGDDELSGGEGNDQLFGGLANDTLYGGLGQDMLSGDDGNDSLSGDADGDMLSGGAGDDLLTGGADSDSLSGDDGDDQLFGEDGNDSLTGGAGADLLIGGVGDDVLSGADGNDVFRISSGDGFDAVEGGLGMDILEATSDDIAIGLTSIAGIEIVDAMGYDGVYLQGSAGADTLDLSGTSLVGVDRIDAGAGDDFVHGSAGDEAITGGLGNDELSGGSGDDDYDFTSGDGHDVITDTAGTEFIALHGIVAADVEVRYSLDQQDYLLTVANGGGSIRLSGAAGLAANSIERVAFDDGTVWTAATLQAMADAGSPPIMGTNGDDILIGTASDDNIQGLGGDDRITPGAGADVIDGGTDGSNSSHDWVLYDDAPSAVAASLVAGGTLGDAAGDSYTGIESILGSAFGDTLEGDGGANALSGDSGNDDLSGGTGNDVLVGGVGNDTLQGGDGDDLFTVSGTNDGFDEIDGGIGIDTLRAEAAGTVFGLSAIAGVETITNNGFANVSILGSSGNDSLDLSVATLTGIAIIDGGAGSDVISGSAGNDMIAGSAGDDTISGAAGNDVLNVTGVGDGFDAVDGGTGTDIILATAANTVIGLRSLVDVETVSANGFAGVSIGGSADADVLNFTGVTLTGIGSVSGGAGDDFITGPAGATIFTGGAGNDSLTGGVGADIFQVAGINDGYDAVNGGAGIDIIRAMTANTVIGLLSLTAVETISANGFTGVGISGSAESDILNFTGVTLTSIGSISGGAGDDTITGAAIASIFVGGTGNDVLTGGAGADIFQFAGADEGFDAIVGGAGSDTIQATANDAVIGLRSLATVEAITSNGFAGVTISGSGIADTLNFTGVTLTGIGWISGGAGDDSITGTAAAATIVGGAGNDTLTGGAGADVFLVAGLNDGFDAVTGGGGTDTVQAASSNTVIGLRSLASVEAVTANGFAGVTISGSGNADTLNFTAVTLTGIGSISGGAGDDTLTGSVGADIFLVTGSGDGFDALTGGTGIDTLQAMADNTVIGLRSLATVDVITANGFAGVSILGSSAGDTLSFATTTLTGIVKIDGALGNDNITGSSAADTIYGGDGADTLIGGSGNDMISGELGNDIVTGGAGDDVLQSGDGDDQFNRSGTGEGLDVIDGGAGTDTIAAQANNTAIGLTSLANVEAITGGVFAGVTILGTVNADALDFTNVVLTAITKIDGGTGNDTLLGSAGADTMLGSGGDDTLSGGLGNDLFQYTFGANGYDTVDGGAGTDTISALANSTVIGLRSFANVEAISGGSATGVVVAGTADADVLDFTNVTLTSITRIDAGLGNDTIIGSAGIDTILGSGGNDLLSGGLGNDVFQYNGAASGFDAVDGGGDVDTITVLANGTVIGLSSLTGVEAIDATGRTSVQIAGSGNGDHLDFTNVTLTAITRIDAGLGNDTITGSLGTDTIFGNEGNDVVSGAAGNDSLTGDNGDDILAGGAGNDTINGGAGIDTVDYSYATADLTVSLAITTSQTVATADADTISNIENLTGGSGADTLTGSTLANVITGGAGNDRITGGTANDSLDGGLGTDVAVFAGLQASYSITTLNGTTMIVDNAPTTDGNDGTDTLVGIEIAEFKGGVQVGIAAPIVLDLNGDGVNLVNANVSSASFDWDGDGDNDRSGWVTGGDGMLAFDRNGDGTVSGAAELSFTSDKSGAKSDLDGLSAFDSNGDGRFSDADTKWQAFHVWVDGNSDGRVDTGELKTLAGAGIASIDLAGQAVNKTWGWGENITVNTGNYTRTNGTKAALSDVALSYQITQTVPSSGASSRQASNGVERLRTRLSGGRGFGRWQLQSSADVLDYFSDVAANDVADRATVHRPSMQYRRVAVDTPIAGNGHTGLADSRLALMAQAIAAFGARSHDARIELRNHEAATYDYFA